MMTARPSFHVSWLDQHCTTIHLNRLSYQQASTIVADVTGGKPLPHEVIEHILDKADGIPLFLEELTRTMIESGQLRDEQDRLRVEPTITRRSSTFRARCATR